MAYSDRVVRAFALAHDLHATQRRKASDVPYLTHLMAVAALVGEYGGDEDVVIAALLHDAVEDQGGEATLARIETEFGPSVASMVLAASDASIVPKPPWRARKEAHLARLVSAPTDVRLIVAADKLHNARGLESALRREGEAIWEHFRGGREGTLWYYGEMLRILGDSWLHPIVDELSCAVESLYRAASEGVTAKT